MPRARRNQSNILPSIPKSHLHKAENELKDIQLNGTRQALTSKCFDIVAQLAMNLPPPHSSLYQQIYVTIAQSIYEQRVPDFQSISVSSVYDWMSVRRTHGMEFYALIIDLEKERVELEQKVINMKKKLTEEERKNLTIVSDTMKLRRQLRFSLENTKKYKRQDNSKRAELEIAQQDFLSLEKQTQSSQTNEIDHELKTAVDNLNKITKAEQCQKRLQSETEQNKQALVVNVKKLEEILQANNEFDERFEVENSKLHDLQLEYEQIAKKNKQSEMEKRELFRCSTPIPNWKHIMDEFPELHTLQQEWDDEPKESGDLSKTTILIKELCMWVKAQPDVYSKTVLDIESVTVELQSAQYAFNNMISTVKVETQRPGNITTNSIVTLGTGYGVPKYLRFAGDVPNRRMKKSEAEDFIHALVLEKLGKEKNRSICMPMKHSIYAYLKNRFEMQSLIPEWGYNILICTEKYLSTDPEMDTFFSCLVGGISSEIYWDLEDLGNALWKYLNKIFKKECTLNTLMKALEVFFPFKREKDFGKLESAVITDHNIADIFTNPQNIVVSLNRIFPNGELFGISSFMHQVRRQHCREIQQYVLKLNKGFLKRDIKKTGRLSRLEIIEVFRETDSRISESKLNSYLSSTNRKSIIEFDLLLQNMRRGLVKPTDNYLTE